MNKLKAMLAVLTFFLVSGVSAQSTVFNVLNLRSAKQSGEIIENNKLVGYYIFYFKEKNDKKTSTYEVELFDDNYNSLNRFEIVRPKNANLLEMVFNGEVFMLHFYDGKTGYEFVTYDRSGKQQGSTIIPVKSISKWELQRATANMSSNTENVTFYPLGTTGFIRQTFTKNKKLGYEIVAYNNEAEELWSYGSSETSTLVETAELNDVNEELVAGTIYKKKNNMTREMDLYCLILNSQTGKLIAEVEMGNEQEGRQSLLKAFVDQKIRKLVLMGEFYKPGDDMLKDKSTGLYMRELSMEGNDLSMTEYKWKGDIDKFKQENLDDEDKKDANKPYYIFFHNVIRTGNGHLFLIGEQFKKQLSAGGVGLKVVAAAVGAGSNTSAFEILIANMVVIEFDETNKMVDFDLIQKKKTPVILSQGMGLWGSTYLGYYLNSLGFFDYSFTSSDKAADKYTVVYTDANRKEEKESTKRSDIMIGVINIDGGKKSQERIPINTEARFWWIQPAKPGFIAVGEYYRKEKKVEFRMEPLAY